MSLRGLTYRCVDWVFVGVIVCLTGVAWSSSHEEAWQHVCRKAPYRVSKPISKNLMMALKRAGVGSHKTWTPTVAWVNDQCQALGMGRKP